MLEVFQLYLENETYKSALGTLAHKSRSNSIGTKAILADWVLEKVQDAFDQFDWAWFLSDKRWLLPRCGTVFTTRHFSAAETDCFSLHTLLLKRTLQIFLVTWKAFKRISQRSVNTVRTSLT